MSLNNRSLSPATFVHIAGLLLALTVAGCTSVGPGGGSSSGGFDGDGDGSGSSTVESSEGTTATTGGTGGSDESSSDGGGTGPKYDVGPGTGTGGTGSCGGGGFEFTNAWINNGFDNTVSKIRADMVEEARYRVHPDGMWGGKPHLASVNLNGDVAVANSCSLVPPLMPDCGGVVKIAARRDDCVDRNGDNAITTSTGPADVEPWWEDECVLWRMPMPGKNFPAAWTSGTKQGCEWTDMKLWTGTTEEDGTSTIYLLDGDDGAVEKTIPIPEVDSPGDLYAAMVDSAGDLWVTGILPQLVHVDLETGTHEVIAAPHNLYSLAVDTDDRVWIMGLGSMSRYDPAPGTWTTVDCPITDGQCILVAQGPKGHMWVAGAVASAPRLRLLELDSEALQVNDQIPPTAFPELTSDARALGFDVEGYMWVVGDKPVLRVDPDTLTYDFMVKDVFTAQMHSDFTGFGLLNVTPEG